MKRYFYVLMLSLYSLVALAEEQVGDATPDITQASENVNSILIVVTQLFVLGIFILGVGFILISIHKYKQHRKSPMFMPLPTVLAMFFGGFFMIMVGVLYFYTGERVFGPDYLSILDPGEADLSV